MPINSVNSAPAAGPTSGTNIFGSPADYDASKRLPSAAAVGALAESAKEGALELKDFGKAGLSLIGMLAAKAVGATDVAAKLETIGKQASQSQDLHAQNRGAAYEAWKLR